MMATPASTMSKRPTSDYLALMAEVRSAGPLERYGMAPVPRMVGLGVLVAPRDCWIPVVRSVVVATGDRCLFR